MLLKPNYKVNVYWNEKIHCQTYLTKVLWLSSACLTQSLKLRTLIRLSFNNATLTNNCIIMLLYYRFYHKKIEIRTSRTNCNLVKEYFCYLPPPAIQKLSTEWEKRKWSSTIAWNYFRLKKRERGEFGKYRLLKDIDTEYSITKTVIRWGRFVQNLSIKMR